MRCYEHDRVLGVLRQGQELLAQGMRRPKLTVHDSITPQASGVKVRQQFPVSRMVYPASPHRDARQGCLKTPRLLCLGQLNRDTGDGGSFVPFTPLGRLKVPSQLLACS